MDNGLNEIDRGARKAQIKKTLVREGLIFIALFGISYLVYLVVRFSTWMMRALKKE